MLRRLRIAIIPLATGCALAVVAPAVAHARPIIRARHNLAKILGGSTAVGTSLGMVARVTYYDGSDNFLCSGTVVASNVVLTAGHCAVNETTGAVDTPGDYQVLTGSQSLSSPGKDSGVTQVIPYPGFDQSTLTGDAALLVLGTPTTASPVALASDPTDLSLYNAGTATVITGWGIDDSNNDLPYALQYGFNVVQNAGYCAQNAADLGATFDPLQQLCAVDAPTDADGTCNGDSGGPILATVGQTWVEIGLTSSGASNCSTALPGFFTRTDTIDNWIGDEIEQNAPAAPDPSPPTTAPTAPTQPQVTRPTPRSGVYRGHTTQRQPIRVRVNPSRTTISDIRFGFDLRCTRHSALSYTITPKLTWKLSDASTTGFTDRFRDRAGTRYRLAGTFSPTGTAAGTLTASWQTAGDGRCTSGPVRWKASTAATS
jgi:secreted trypsin-like serine protease